MPTIKQWRVMVARTVTGQIIADVRTSQLPTFARGMNDDVGSWGVTVPLDDPSNASVDLRSFARSTQYSWVVCYGDFVAQAGPPTTYGINDKSRELTVGGVGIGGLFKRRVMRNSAGHTAIVHPSEDIVATNSTIRRMVRDMVSMNMAQSGYSLPIDVDTTNESGTSKNTYYAYELKTVAELMNQYADNYVGCEYEFAPYLTPDRTHVRWTLRVQSPRLGNQNTSAVWDYGSAMETLDVDGDGSAATATRAWSKGSGSDRDLKTGFAENTALLAEGYPGLDYVDGEHTSVTEQATLEGYADAALEAFRYPLETWSAEIQIDGRSHSDPTQFVAPALGTWDIGDAPLISVRNHLWIPNGTYRRRILGYSSSTADRVKLILQEGDPV